MSLKGSATIIEGVEIPAVLLLPPQPMPRVTVSAGTPTYDSNTGVWSYSYSIQIMANSQLDLGSFTLEGIAPRCFTTGPEGWYIVNEWQGPGGIHWNAEVTPGSPLISPYRGVAGTTKSGFSFKSYGAPGEVQFVCEGEAEPVVYEGEEDGGEAFRNAGGLEGSIYSNATFGSTTGPVGSNVPPCPPSGGGGGDEDPPPIEQGPTSAPPDSTLGVLGARHPSPARSGQAISLLLRAPGRVRLVLFDIRGRKIAQLLDERFSPGRHTITWDGRDSSGHRVTAGTYYYRLYVNGRAIGSQATVIVR